MGMVPEWTPGPRPDGAEAAPALPGPLGEQEGGVGVPRPERPLGHQHAVHRRSLRGGGARPPTRVEGRRKGFSSF